MVCYYALMHDPVNEIERLREWRSNKGHNLSILGTVESIQTSARQSHRKLGELIELWHELLPDDLAKASTLRGIRSGLLQVEVESSAKLYEIDRRLREGILQELRSRYHGTLVRVKIRLEAGENSLSHSVRQ